MKICLIGSGRADALEGSYQRAFERLGAEVSVFDMDAHQQPYVRLGKLGRAFHRFVPIDAWQRKLNRDLALALRAAKPDLALVFCNAPVLFGTLAFIKSLSTTRFVLVWPDPLTNLQPHVAQAAPLYDGVATYCRASVPVFSRLGFQNVQWVPLAADPDLHRIDTVPARFTHDLIFIGARRPEREQTLTAIARHFPGLNLRIWGTDWQRSRSRVLRPFVGAEPLRGRAYAEAMNRSRINLNGIDATGFPAANMRFFEVPIAHGLQLSSACPEFAEEYRDGQHGLTYADTDALMSQTEWAMQHDANPIRREGFQYTLAYHTYDHRVSQIRQFFLSSTPILTP